MVLNAVKYREMATREDSKNSTRERVAHHRATQRNSAQLGATRNTSAQLGTPTNVTPLESSSGNGHVTLSEAEAEVDTKTSPNPQNGESEVRKIWGEYPSILLPGIVKEPSQAAEVAIFEAIVRDGFDLVLAGTRNYRVAVEKWTPSQKRFLRAIDRFFNDSDYAKDPAIWEKNEQGKYDNRTKGKRDIEASLESLARAKEILRRRRMDSGAVDDSGDQQGATAAAGENSD